MMLRYLFNPAALLTDRLQGNAVLSGFLISGLAFALFFTQTALDGNSSVSSGMVKGALFGTAGIAFCGLIIWLIAKTPDNRYSLVSVLGTVAMSYSSTLIFTLVGFILHYSLGWNTAISCGITGVLAAFGPMSGVISVLTNERKTLNLLILTFAGVYVLLLWAILNNIL